MVAPSIWKTESGQHQFSTLALPTHFISRERGTREDCPRSLETSSSHPSAARRLAPWEALESVPAQELK